MERPARSETFGLDDPQVLAVATQVSPDLFAASAISKQAPADSFPISDVNELKRLWRSVAKKSDAFESLSVVNRTPYLIELVRHVNNVVTHYDWISPGAQSMAFSGLSATRSWVGGVVNGPAGGVGPIEVNFR